MTDIRAAARRTVCVFAKDIAEATELMLMLGIHPSQDDDLEMYGSTDPTPPNRLTRR